MAATHGDSGAIRRHWRAVVLTLAVLPLGFVTGVGLGLGSTPPVPGGAVGVDGATLEGWNGPGQGPEVVTDTAEGLDGAAIEPDGPDADGDGLSDRRERELGTDPADPDTDGDGFSDGMEVACRDALPGADPLRKDVYVEVDSTTGASLSEGAAVGLQRAFARAPVSNPDGTDGVALHLVASDGDLPQDGTVGNRPGPGDHDDMDDYRRAHFDRAGQGYHYLVVVTDASYDGDDSYAGTGTNGTAVVQAQSDDRAMASLVMHELGHAFGIAHGEEGVDEDRYSLAAYRSVMNYNGVYDVLTYADGTGERGVDEWAVVADGRRLPDGSCGRSHAREPTERGQT